MWNKRSKSTRRWTWTVYRRWDLNWSWPLQRIDILQLIQIFLIFGWKMGLVNQMLIKVKNVFCKSLRILQLIIWKVNKNIKGKWIRDCIIMKGELQGWTIPHCNVLVYFSKSEFVTDSLHVFKGGPLDSSSNHISKIT